MASEASPEFFPTPPASSVAASQHASPLPQPRRHPLHPGGPRESELIRYLDHGVNQVQKRVDNRVTHGKSTSKPAPGDDGYSDFAQVAQDLDALVDVVWVSGSRTFFTFHFTCAYTCALTPIHPPTCANHIILLANLQTPYLLNIAVLTTEFLTLFPVSDRSKKAIFSLLSKLDYAFSSLLTGHDTATGEALSGFENGRSISTTDKVRLKGIVDRTRLTVVRVMSQESVLGNDDSHVESANSDVEGETPLPPVDTQDTIVFEGFEDNDGDDEDDDWEERNIGSIYEKTIAELGDVLRGPPIGIISDD